MPWVRINLSEGRTPDQKKEAAAAITDVMARVFGCSVESVSIVFSDVKPHDWASGGRLLSEPKRE